MNILVIGILFFYQFLIPLLFGDDFLTPQPSDEPAAMSIIVVSDPHVMAPELLLNDGTAFADYIAGDRKMLRESPLLMEEATQKILAARPQYVFIAGDLTKDGEMVSHLILRDRYLKRLREAGISVFVVPGNHDVDNPHAVEYDGATTRRVATPDADGFAEIYSDYGYGAAIARDTASLSYVVQLDEATRLLCLDACEYEENSYEDNVCVTAGRLKEATIRFIEQQGRQAQRDDMRLLAMIHHGVVQHWTWQDKAMAEYLVDDWHNVAKTLERAGVEIAFTGHFHAQDISRRGDLYDVETGSLVSYPSPMRTVTIDDDVATIHTEWLTGKCLNLDVGVSLEDYSRGYACDGITTIVNRLLPEETSDEVRADACAAVCEAYVAHLGGDEQMPAEKEATIKAVAAQIKPYSWKLAYIFSHIAKNLWNDLGESDNDIVIELKQ